MSPAMTKVINMQTLNEKLIAANHALALGTIDGLKQGLGLLVESLPIAGRFIPALLSSIQELRSALSHHYRADIQDPRDSTSSREYFLLWKNDVYDRDKALHRACKHLGLINNALQMQ